LLLFLLLTFRSYGAWGKPVVFQTKNDSLFCSLRTINENDIYSPVGLIGTDIILSMVYNTSWLCFLNPDAIKNQFKK
jgi:hypothetical protein